MRERRTIAIRKKKEVAKRRQRRKNAKEGIPFALEDDGKEVAEDGVVKNLIRSQRGNLIPVRKGLWYRSTVPVPKGRSRDKLARPSAR